MSDYGTERLLDGKTVGFLSSGHDHRLEHDKKKDEIIVTTNYVRFVLPQCVWNQIGEFWTAKQAKD